MKKTIIVLFIFSLLIPPSLAKAESNQSMKNRLSGKIMLAVERSGEAYYINPADKVVYYLGGPEQAFAIMRKLSLGVSNKDFNSFNSKAPIRLSGRILIKPEDNGRAFYVDPSDLSLNYLGRPNDAFNIMRSFGIGINSSDLEVLLNSKLNVVKSTFSEKDSDGDGLTDKEETLIYKTNPLKTDTNENGYNDGVEIESGYDAVGKKGKLPAFSTAENTLNDLEKAISECNVDFYFNRIENFTIIPTSTPINLYKEILLEKASGNKFKNIKFVDKKVTDSKNIYFKYSINYTDTEGVTYSSENKEIYLTNVSNGWKINYAKQSEVELYEQKLKTRDARRIADIQQIRSALELYYNDANKYPSEIEAGKSLKFEETVYMMKVPEDPSSTKDSKKIYEYASIKNGSNYSLTYFLESNLSDMPAGKNIASMSGLTTLDKNKIRLRDEGIVKKCVNAFNKLESEMSQNTSLITELTEDEQKYITISHIKAALEMHYNDANKYPLEVKAGEPLKFGDISYIDKIQKNQNPVSANCKNNPDFVYTQKNNGAAYELNFCLENDYKKFKKGDNTTSQSDF